MTDFETWIREHKICIYEYYEDGSCLEAISIKDIEKRERSVRIGGSDLEREKYVRAKV